MKYSININQIAVYNIDKKLDIKDAAILDYLKSFCSADDKNMSRMDINEQGLVHRYTWINFQHLIAEMPLLQFNQVQSVSNRLKKIKKAGLIKTHTFSPTGKGQRVYVRLTDKFKELDFYDKNTQSYNADQINLDLGLNKSKEPTKQINAVHKDTTDLFDYYKEQFIDKISDNPPIFNWGQCEKLAKSHITSLGLDKMKGLLDIYLNSDDSFYKEQCYSLSCFLSSKILHKLNQEYVK